MAKERESRERGKLADTERNSRERRKGGGGGEKEEAKEEVVGEKERERTVKFEM